MTTNTPDQLREIDAAVAEHVMGWKWVQAPKYDYDGPLPDQGKVLVPPTLDERTYQWPPRGLIGPLAFVNGWSLSTDVSAAWEVVEKLRHRDPLIRTDGDGWGCILLASDDESDMETIGDDPRTYSTYRRRAKATADTMPLAVCLAALKAVGKPWGEDAK